MTSGRLGNLGLGTEAEIFEHSQKLIVLMKRNAKRFWRAFRPTGDLKSLSMTRNQACIPCAKRKVRCDKGTPCSNCKRRKQDQCSYIELANNVSNDTQQTIQDLEALVQRLGGDHTQGGRPLKRQKLTAKSSSPAHQDPTQPRLEPSGPSEKTKGPLIFEEDGQIHYHESWAAKNWYGKRHSALPGIPSSGRQGPQALESIFQRKPLTELVSGHPNAVHVITLWNAFRHRVYPILRILFSWTVDELELVSSDPEMLKTFSESQHALVFALYTISVISLSESECLDRLQRSKSDLLCEFQLLCESALAHTNILCISDITVLKALTVYLMAGIDRLSTQSLWSVSGIIMRNAERLGIHRDGSILGLNSLETEDRRRLWWQLQHLDLALSVRLGISSLNLTAGWDAKMPLNLEDKDISAGAGQRLVERTGLTSMSYCRFTFWVIDQQRRAFETAKGAFELSWQSSASLSMESKNSLIDQLEQGLNDNFLRYCNPIKPIDVLLQLVARALINGMRERTIHSVAFEAESNQIDESYREELLMACMQSLEYNIAIHTQPLISQFRWLTTGFFPWHAFMCILVEASQQSSFIKSERMWNLLTDVYAANSSLLELWTDRRKHHAAKLVVAAGKAYQSRSDSGRLHKLSSLVADLEEQLARTTFQAEVGPINERPPTAKLTTEPGTSSSLDSIFMEPELDLSTDFDFGYEDIDWHFWQSID